MGKLHRNVKPSLTTTLVVLLLATSRMAYAGAGAGVTLGYVIGRGPTFGVRAVSSRDNYSAVETLGIDYMFESRSVRPVVGVAYAGNHSMLELNLGYSSGEFDVGGTLGTTNTQQEAGPVSAIVVY